MDNAAFRSFKFGANAAGSQSAAAIPAAKKKGKKKGKWRPKKQKPQAGNHDDADKPDEPKWRDRAAERRKGLDVDYGDTAELSKQVDGGMTAFLGGDQQHTHLVKGLDRALLHEMRAKQAVASAGDAGAPVPTSHHQDSPAATATQPAEAAVVRPQHSPAVRQMLKGVAAFATGRVRPRAPRLPLSRVRERFLPGRFGLEYRLVDCDPMATQPATFFAAAGQLDDAPTLTTRAKEDCPAPTANLRPKLTASQMQLLGEVARAAAGGAEKLERLRRRREKEARKRRRQALQQAGAAAHAAGGSGDSGDSDQEGQGMGPSPDSKRGRAE